MNLGELELEYVIPAVKISQSSTKSVKSNSEIILQIDPSSALSYPILSYPILFYPILSCLLGGGEVSCWCHMTPVEPAVVVVIGFHL
jgi:hypothetical protein